MCERSTIFVLDCLLRGEACASVHLEQPEQSEQPEQEQQQQQQHHTLEATKVELVSLFVL